MMEVTLTLDNVYMVLFAVALLVALVNGIGIFLVIKQLAVSEEAISYEGIYPSGLSTLGPSKMETLNPSPKTPRREKTEEAKSAIEPDQKEYDEAAAKTKAKAKK